MLRFLLVILATSSLTMVFSRAQVFRPIRLRILISSSYFGELVTCPFCTSFYVAAALSAIYRPLGPGVWNLVLSTFVVMALAPISMWVIYQAIKGLGPSKDVTYADRQRQRDEVGV